MILDEGCWNCSHRFHCHQFSRFTYLRLEFVLSKASNVIWKVLMSIIMRVAVGADPGSTDTVVVRQVRCMFVSYFLRASCTLVNSRSFDPRTTRFELCV